MYAKTNLSIDYPTEFDLTIRTDPGCWVLVLKHLKQLPGLLTAVGSKTDNILHIQLEADDYNHALWRVRNHLRPVCGVVEVS